jgi:hypothetical protein
VSAPVLCTVGVVVMFYIEWHWIHQNTWKSFVCCLLSGCGINAFRMASSNSSRAEKSCACAYIAFLAGIFSWYADCKCTLSDWLHTESQWRLIPLRWIHDCLLQNKDVILEVFRLVIYTKFNINPWNISVFSQRYKRTSSTWDYLAASCELCQQRWCLQTETDEVQMFVLRYREPNANMAVAVCVLLLPPKQTVVPNTGGFDRLVFEPWYRRT